MKPISARQTSFDELEMTPYQRSTNLFDADSQLFWRGRCKSPWTGGLIKPISYLDRGARGRLAILALQELGPRAKMAIPTLADILHKSDHQYSSSAANALASIGPEGFRPLSVALTNQDAFIRKDILFALLNPSLSNDQNNVALVFIKHLTDKDEDVRRHAESCLTAIARRSPIVLPQLITRSAHTNALVRRSIVDVIGLTAIFCWV